MLQQTFRKVKMKEYFLIFILNFLLLLSWPQKIVTLIMNCPLKILLTEKSICEKKNQVKIELHTVGRLVLPSL